MGVLSSPVSGDEKGEVNQSFEELKKENNPVVESLIDPEDLFVDSLLDFDFLRDWMDSDNGSENPIIFSSEEVELNAMESIAEEGLKLDVSGDVGRENSKTETGGEVMVEEGSVGEGCGKLKDSDCGSENPVIFSLEEVELNAMESADMKRIAEEGLKLDVSGDLGRENIKTETGGEVMVGEGSVGDGCGKVKDSDCGSENPVIFSSEEVELNAMESADMESIAEEGLKLDVSGDVGRENSKMETGGEVMVEEGSVGDGCGKLKDLRCLIEEEMGKIKLDGASNVSSASGTESGDLDVAKQISVKGDSVDDIVQSVGNDNEIVVAGQDENEAKSQDQENDGDESENDSGSESDDESESSSSSSSSSSSLSSDDDDDDEGEEEMGKRGEEGEEEKETEEGEIVISDNEDGSDGGDTAATAPIRSKNEITNLPPVPPVNVTLLPHHKTQPVGAVLSMLGSQVVIEGIEKHNPLNEGSILWITDSRSPLGIVDEVFGQVKSPHYIVRYNSESEVPSGIKPGTLVSFVPEFAAHVLNDKSIYQKGYDASGANDEEVLDEEDFSDDEKEAEHRSLVKIKKRGITGEKVGNKKNNKKKSQNCRGKWKSDQSASAAAVAAANHPQVPLRPELVQSSSGQTVRPPFAQTGPNPSFNMPAVGSNVIPSQVPWMPMVHQMPPPPSGLPYQQQRGPLLQSGMLPFQHRPLLPFQQQIDPFLAGGGQLGVVPPGFLPPATFLNQGMHNNHNTPFGMMGTPGGQQHTPLPMNLPPPQIGYNQSSQPDNNSISGNTSSMQPPWFNPGRYSGGGCNRSHGRRGGGGGRFGGPGRGRQ